MNGLGVEVLRGPADTDAEALAAFVVDEEGRLIKDRRGAGAPVVSRRTG